MGQSLGTGVTVGLASSLASEGISPRAVVLVAPFTSIPELLETYKLGSILPILVPFKSIPGAVKLFLKVLRTSFDSISLIQVSYYQYRRFNETKTIFPQNIKSPILILHAENDSTIPFSHGFGLFNHLTSIFSTSKSTLQSAGGWGSVQRLERGNEGRIIFGQAKKGGHNEIGSGEYSMSLIKEILA